MRTSKSAYNPHLDKISGQLVFVKALIFLIIVLLITVLVRADWKLENIQIIPTSKQTTTSVFTLNETSAEVIHYSVSKTSLDIKV
ncbi:MAG: hypothetical protein ACPGVB_01320 [Chitinophagales bacterium]